MGKEQIIKKIRSKKVREFLDKNGIAHISLFGSYAKGEAKKDSDIDLLFEEKKGVLLNLFELAMVVGFLMETFKKEVDFVDKNNILPALKKEILSHKIDII